MNISSHEPPSFINDKDESSNNKNQNSYCQDIVDLHTEMDKFLLSRKES